MSALFNQANFIGGLNTRLEASKLPEGQYSLLINGRVTRNTIAPVKKHLKLNLPAGRPQGLYSIGSILVVFIAGHAYWRNLASQIPAWAPIPNWNPMDAGVDRIYAELVPVSYFQGSIDYTESGDPQDVKVTFPGIPAQTQSFLFVTDGLNQPRVIAADGTWREVGTYATWTIANPEYAPICVLPAKAGQKLYLVDPATRTKIYNSVSGRFLDFVIRRSRIGDKDGDAETTFKSVDFNPITALFEVDNGGLFVGTLYASYVVYPDYTKTMFAEPALREQKLFPTGPVNERSFADLGGDLGFITQVGIQSFNAVLQSQSESNNNSIGALISSLLVTPQQNTCATNYDTEALFAVRTIYGYGVMVYDTTLERFISLDLDFGQVTDFANVKYNGGQRLFFLTAQGEVFEAYADSEYSTCRVYLGDYGTYDPESGQQLAGQQHKISAIRLQFGNVKESFQAQVSLFADRKLVKTDVREIVLEESYPEQVPSPLPFPGFRQAYPADFRFEDTKFCWKSGIWLEWQGRGELLSITAEGDRLKQDSFTVLAPQVSAIKKVVMFSDSKFQAVVADTLGWTCIQGLEERAWYSIVGQCHVGGKLYSNELFQMTWTEANVNGRLTKCGQLKNIWDLMTEETPDIILGAGNHAWDAGDEADVQQIVNLFGKNSSKVFLSAGSKDLDTNAGKAFFGIRATPRMYVKNLGNTDFFMLNSGINSAGALVESLGNTSDSQQAKWLQEQLSKSQARFKIVVFNHPPYAEDSVDYPGFAALRWPFKFWGADMVVCGHSKVYQRFAIDNIPYVVLPGCMEDSALGSLKTTIVPSAIIRRVFAGYARLRVDAYTTLVEVVDRSSVVQDAFGIYA